MLTLTEAGLFCPRGGFAIDPKRRVDKAVITHAHSDHLRRGSRVYYCSAPSVPLVRARISAKAEIIGVPFGQPVEIGGVRVSFHPAGHVLGSAQIRIEDRGDVWAVSGDYKRQHDPSCESFEVVPCDTYITEATFGSPCYRWPDPAEVVQEMRDWWADNRLRGKNSLLLCYSLGKTQRVLAEMGAKPAGEIYLYGEGVILTEAYRQAGALLPPAKDLETATGSIEGALIIAGHSIQDSGWIERLGFPDSAHVSGWALSHGGRRRFGMEGFAMSDHADWQDLLRTIRDTGARRVLVGDDGDQLVAELQRSGVSAAPLTLEGLASRGRPVQGELFL